MNLLITGGTGFFGRALIKYLEAERLAKGQLPFEKVGILSRSPDRFRTSYPSLADLPWIQWHQGDVQLASSLPHGHAYECILHAAADSTDAAALTPIQKYRQIVDGTENMLQFASTHGAKRFLFVSSGGAYGPQPPDMPAIAESYLGMPDPLLTSSVYGVAKRQAEHLCALYSHSHGLETVVARCFAFVGPDLPLDAHFAIGNFIRDALGAAHIQVGGDGTPMRSYMEQSDLAHWLLQLLLRGRSCQAYNVGSDEAINSADLAHLVRDCLAPHKPVLVMGQRIEGNPRNRYVPSVAKARHELGLTLSLSLREAILRTAAFHKIP